MVDYSMEQISNSALSIAQEWANSPAVKIAREMADNQALIKAIASPAFQMPQIQTAQIQNLLNSFCPKGYTMPIYNADVFENFQASICSVANVSDSLAMINNLFPDRTVFDSITQTAKAFEALAKDMQSYTKNFKPIWDLGYAEMINPSAIYESIQADEEVLDEQEFTEDVEELLMSDTPEEAIVSFTAKRGKISQIVLRTIAKFGLELAFACLIHVGQPLIDEIPQIPIKHAIHANQEINNNEVEFSVFCVENIAIKLGISGQEVYELLTVKSNVLDEYIIPNYEILHTQSKDYIVNDIIEYMKECGVIK